MKQIKKFPNYQVDEDGFIQNRHTKRYLTPVERNGYLNVRLSKDGRVHYRSLHRLIVEAFMGDIPSGMHVNHINGVRNDNRLVNLEICTPEENNQRRLLLNRGTNVNTAKLTEEQVMDIRLRKSRGERTLDMAREYGIHKSSINRIVIGGSWKHLPVLPVDKSHWGNPKITGAMSGSVLNKKYGEDYFLKIRTGNRMKKHCASCSCNS